MEACSPNPAVAQILSKWACLTWGGGCWYCCVPSSLFHPLPPPIPAWMIASEPSLHSERWQYLDSVWNSSHPSQPGGPWRSRGPVGTSGIQGQRQISCWLRSAAQDPRMSSTLYYLELIFRKRPFRTCQKTAVASLSGLFLPAKHFPDWASQLCRALGCATHCF